MYMRIFFLPLVLLFWGCNTESDSKESRPIPVDTVETTFNHTRWSIKEGDDYPYREKMVNTILYTDTIRSLAQDEVLELLGKPDRIAGEYLYYMITQKRLGSWPLHTKTLVIKFTEADSIDWIKIHE
jgi:hypothetical protein